MILASLPCSTAAEQLALDEALLDFCEAQPGHPGFMRFWEPALPFVALGYSKAWRKEVYEAFCEARNIPILRRCSGGGTVLQARGCLNYALVLPIHARPELNTINSTNCFIMKEQATAVRQLDPGISAKVEVEGYSDLTLKGDDAESRKFSGNSQRRKRHYLLFHGCFLLSADLDLIQQALRMPEQKPNYRGKRRHLDFLANFPATGEQLRAALVKHWGAVEDSKLDEAALNEITGRMQTLAQEKYGREDWNFRF